MQGMYRLAENLQKMDNKSIEFKEWFNVNDLSVSILQINEIEFLISKLEIKDRILLVYLTKKTDIEIDIYVLKNKIKKKRAINDLRNKIKEILYKEDDYDYNE